MNPLDVLTHPVTEVPSDWLLLPFIPMPLRLILFLGLGDKVEGLHIWLLIVGNFS